jgi:hypothetical protein
MTLTVIPGGREPSIESLRQQADRIRRHTRTTPPPPGEPTAFELVTRQMVESLTEDMRDIKGKLTNLNFVIIGAVVIDVITRAIGS